jgi:hypothetical protein
MKRLFKMVKHAKKFTTEAQDIIHNTQKPTAVEALLSDIPATGLPLDPAELTDMACAIDLSRCLNKGQMSVCVQCMPGCDC